MKISRFAPTPSGFLHAGNIYSAWLIDRWRRHDKKFRVLLRIEDIDLGRTRAHFCQGIIDDLDFFGFRYYGEVGYQRPLFGRYVDYLLKLADLGLIYVCFCSRGQIKKRTGGVSYDGFCRLDERVNSGRMAEYLLGSYQEQLEQGGAPMIRLNVDRAREFLLSRGVFEIDCVFYDDPSSLVEGRQRHEVFRLAGEHKVGSLGDFALTQKDFPASYVFASTIDDAFDKVGLIIRGKDLLPMLEQQLLLQQVFEFGATEFFYHELITYESKKMSKSDQESRMASLVRRSHHGRNGGELLDQYFSMSARQTERWSESLYF